MRAAFTLAPHMHLYVIYPVVLAFGAGFLALGLRNFRRRVLSRTVWCACTAIRGRPVARPCLVWRGAG